MYIPKPFQQQNFDAIKQLMAEFPLATIVAHTTDNFKGNSDNSPGALSQSMEACHIPLFWEDSTSKNGSEYGSKQGIENGVLIGHAFKGNPIVKETFNNNQWLVIFQDTSCYISPNWYPNKAKTHKEVPTWNYRVAHLTVEPTFITDPEQLKYMVGKLSDIHEATQAEPWSLDDAPDDFIDKLCKAIVGFRLKIIDVQAQFKLSQNKDEVTRQSIISNLHSLNTEASHSMAKNISGFRK